MKKSIILLVATLAATVVNASYLYWQINEETVNNTGISGEWARLVAHSDTETVEQFAQLDNNGKMPAYRTFDISSLSGEASSYSYWVELGTYSNVGTPSATFSAQVSSWSDAKTYSDLSSYIATTTLSDIPTTQIWHGGTMSVPEPTSAVLMLFGAAFLGLKRKNRSVA